MTTITGPHSRQASRSNLFLYLRWGHTRVMIVRAPCMLRCTGAARALHRQPPPSPPARYRRARSGRQRVMRTNAWLPFWGTAAPLLQGSSRQALAEAAAGGVVRLAPTNPLDAMLHIGVGQAKQVGVIAKDMLESTWAFSDIW